MSSSERLARHLPFQISPRAGLVLCTMLMAACSAQDCGCNGFETKPFPPQHYDKTLVQASQIRVSPAGLDFVEQNVGPLIDGALPDGLNFCLPRDTSSDTKLCFPYVRDRSGHHAEGEQPVCNDGSAGCQVSLTIDDAQIIPKPPKQLDVQVLIGNVNPTIPFETSVAVIGTVKCDVTAYKKGTNINTPATIKATLPVNFDIDQMSPTRDLQIDLDEVQLNLDDLDFDLKGGFKCGAADFLRGLFRGTIEDQLRGQLKDAVDNLVRGSLCLSCADDRNACPDSATCADDGVCDYTNGDTCVPAPLGVEGSLHLSELIGSYVQEKQANVDTLFKLGDYANVDTGVTLAARAGFQPERFSNCVPVDPSARPALTPIPISQTITGDVRPGTNDPFMVGLGIHKRAVEHVLWSAWASGGTCLNIDSSASAQLSTAALGLVLRSISRLADDKNRQAEIKLVPQQAPSVVLGANRVTETAEGYTVDEGLMTIDWRDLDLHIYGWVQDRWTRLVTVRLDLLLPVAVVPDGMGSVSVVLGDLEEAITNLRPRNNLLLSEDPQRLAELIPTLVGLALPSLASALDLAFELPEFFGLRIALDQGDITSVDNGEFIALFADLEPGMMTNDLALLPTPHVRAHEVSYPGLGEEAIVQPVVRVEMGAELLFGPQARQLVAGEEVEYAWRVDGGFWSLYQKQDTLTLTDPLLRLPGEHVIEVRARVAGDARRVNREQLATLPVRIDYQEPELTLERAADNRLRFVAYDLTDGPGELTYRWRGHDGERASAWSAWQHESELDLNTLDLSRGAVRVEVEVRDRSGFVARDTQTIRPESLEVQPAGNAPVSLNDSAAEPSAAGCAQAPNGSPSGTPGALLLGVALGMVGLLRRRRVAALGSVLALLGLTVSSGCSGCSDDKPSGQTSACEEGCATGEVCSAGKCVPNPMQGCTGDADCQNGQLCQAGVCADPECTEDAQCAGSCEGDKMGVCVGFACSCDDFCPEGCGDGEFCCYTQNACQPIPDPCDGKVCDPGFEPGMPTPGTPDSNTCTLSGASCECVPLPPLPLGAHGRYSDLASDGSTVVVSTYNTTYGDLMVGRVEADRSVMRWAFVDGVPATGDIEGALDGPRGGIKDRGDNIGTHTAIALDAQGVPHVFYRDEKNAALKYARGTLSAEGFSFETKVLDAEGDAGRYSDVVFFEGRLHLVYSAANVPAADPSSGPNRSELRYLTLDPSAAFDAVNADAHQVVAQGVGLTPCATACAGDTVCLSGTGQCITPSSDCATSCADGFACTQGSCEATFDPVAPAGVPFTTGNYMELTAHPSHGLLLLFHDGAQQSVAWSAKPNGGEWSMPLYVGAGSGPYASGVFGEDGAMHIAYMDEPSASLKYMKVPTGGSAQNDTIISGLRDTGEEWLVARIGEDVQLQLAADGAPEVVFHDATLHRLMHARRMSPEMGPWSSDVISQRQDPFDGSHGFYPSLMRAGADSLVIEYVIDNQADPVTAYPAIYPLP